MGHNAISLQNFKAADGFWKDEMELIRTKVLPYQWDSLNDRVEGAAPSYCMRNFKIAGKLIKESREHGTSNAPVSTFRGFESLPEDPSHLEDKFYGFVFQDSDFSKWIEAVAYSLISHPDAALEKTADEAIDLVCAAQLDNGYLDTFYIINGMDKAFTNLRDHHELYCFGHLTEGAVAYYEATGKRKLLDAVIRFADYIDAYFGAEEGKCKGYPGHEIAEMALVRLYQVTGEERYLKLAKFFIDERGKQPYYWDSEDHLEKLTEGERYAYHQAHRPVREQEEAVGHAVRAVYLYSGMADVAKLTGDEGLWKACKQLWNSVTREKMYITGGIGASHIEEAFSFPFDLPNDTAYAETCASIGLVFWARRMLEREVKAEYADVMELALYNTVLAGMDLSGTRFFYVNPLEVLPEACLKDERKFHVKPVRQKWFGCACCPPNLARMVGSVPSYAFTETEDTLYMHLHITGEVTKNVQGKQAAFAIQSGFPWAGNVSITYQGQPDASIKLAVRVPGWCKDKKLDVPGHITYREENGYLYFSGDWQKGDCIQLNFPMEIKFYQANPRVRETIGKIAVKKGPLVYCAEGVDNGENLHQYRVLADQPAAESKVQICGKQFPCIRIKAVKENEAWDQTKLYQEYHPAQCQEAELTLIPYYAWANRGENEMMVWMRQ